MCVSRIQSRRLKIYFIFVRKKGVVEDNEWRDMPHSNIVCGSPIKMLINYAKIGRNNCNHVSIFYSWKFICTNKNALLTTNTLLLSKSLILVINFTLIVVFITLEPEIVGRGGGS